jgi:DNA-directed RNA polymerase alpha subunit
VTKSIIPQNQTSGFPKIPQPALRALANAGYHRLEQLTQVSESKLGKLHGMGPKALRLLKQSLAEEGLAFLPD